MWNRVAFLAAAAAFAARAIREEDPAIGHALIEQMLIKYLAIEADERAGGCAFGTVPRA